MGIQCRLETETGLCLVRSEPGLLHSHYQGTNFACEILFFQLLSGYNTDKTAALLEKKGHSAPPNVSEVVETNKLKECGQHGNKSKRCRSCPCASLRSIKKYEGNFSPAVTYRIPG